MGLEGSSLVIGDKEFWVLGMSTELHQPVDSRGVPSGIPRGGFINLKLVGINHNVGLIIGWMISPTRQLNGYIDIKAGRSVSRRIQFFDAYCVYYKEVFTEDIENWNEVIGTSRFGAGGTGNFTVECRLSCREISWSSEESLQNIDWGSETATTDNDRSSSSASASSSLASSDSVSSFNPMDES